MPGSPKKRARREAGIVLKPRHPRARAIPELSRDERVKRCLELMRDKRWSVGESGALLAEEWGCSLDVVADCASEAARHLRILKEPEAVLERVMLATDEVLHRSRQDTARVQAGRLMLEATGQLKQKVELSAETRPIEESFAEIAASPVFLDWLEQHEPIRAHLVSRGWTAPTPALEEHHE